MPKAPPKIKPFLADFGAFPHTVLVCLGSSDREVLRALDQYQGITDEDRANVLFDRDYTGAFCISMKNVTLVVLRTRDVPQRGEPRLQHEIFHAVTMNLTRAGVRFSDDSDEVFAYTIEHLTEQINAKLRPLHKRRKSGTLRT